MNEINPPELDRAPEVKLEPEVPPPPAPHPVAAPAPPAAAISSSAAPQLIESYSPPPAPLEQPARFEQPARLEPSAQDDLVYFADTPDSATQAGDGALAATAALLSHRGAQTPISIGLLGGPGAGKSSALRFLAEKAAAQSSDRNGARMVAAHIDAAEAAAEPATTIGAKIYDALTQQTSDSGRSASLAREAVASLRDLHAVAREAADRLAEMRQRLETERSALEAVAGRRARLAETVLFETPGSRVDSYARAHRAKIESMLRTFGFDGDLTAVWKELTREMAERNPVEKAMACIQSLWAYRGQTRLLVLTVIFALIAWALGAAEASWIAGMQTNGNAQIAASGGWLEAHMSLITTLKSLSALAAVLCLLFDVGRAARFLSSIFKGSHLLKIDIEARRRDLDALLAHQTRRVDLVTREVEAQARRADDAERHAEGPRASISRTEEMKTFYGAEEDGATGRARFAREFVAALGSGLAREGAEAPRIVAFIDGFETLPPERAISFAQEASRLLARPGFATVFALDDARVRNALGDSGSLALNRLFQIPVRLGVVDQDGNGAGAAGRLSEPLSASETTLLQALAPFAGAQPRDAKRFANVYRLARASSSSDSIRPGALGLSVLAALGAFGVGAASQATRGGEAWTAAQKASADAGFPATNDELAVAWPLASRFGLSA